MKRSINILLFLLVSVLIAQVEPRHYDYNGAVRQMHRIYFGDLQETLYCGCHYKSKKKIDFNSCDYAPRDNPKRKSYRRAHRIEWEHIVTAHNMGHFLSCWKEGGRKSCSNNNEQFDLMEGDLHNLYPSIGEINGDRSHFMFSQWTNEPKPMYGKCLTIVDFKLKKIQPRKEVRGLIARISFYMEKTYGVALSNQDRKLFEAWDRMYPINRKECLRDKRIYNIQGNHNPFVYNKCLEENLYLDE